MYPNANDDSDSDASLSIKPGKRIKRTLPPSSPQYNGQNAEQEDPGQQEEDEQENLCGFGQPLEYLGGYGQEEYHQQEYDAQQQESQQEGVDQQDASMEGSGSDSGDDDRWSALGLQNDTSMEGSGSDNGSDEVWPGLSSQNNGSGGADEVEDGQALGSADATEMTAQGSRHVKRIKPPRGNRPASYCEL